MVWGGGLGPVEIMRALSTQGRAGQADSGWQGELNREIDQDLRLWGFQPKCCSTPARNIPQIASSANCHLSRVTSTIPPI